MMLKRGDHIMGLLTWLFGGHSKPTASTAATAKSTTVESPKKTKKMTTKKSTKKTTTKKSTAKKGRGRPKKK